jgi:ATP-binding cassette subfamily F protein 3
MINLVNVSLRRGSRLLFEQASLAVYRGQRIGVTGANGVGKTSLFGVLEGHVQTDSGEVGIPAKLEIASVSQEVEALDIKARDYVMAGDRELVACQAELSAAEAEGDGTRIAHAHESLYRIGGYDADARAARVLAGLGFSEAEQAMSFAHFSGGWRMRLNLARALMCRSDLLLLDEPTNHLDLDAIIWLEDRLISYKGALLLISHDRDFLDTVCTHIVHIENQRVSMYTGNYSAFEQQRAARLANQQAAYVKQQREIAHMQKFVERFRAKASKARQAQSRLKALARLELIAAAHVDSPFSFAFEKPAKLPHQLVSVRHADFGYTDVPVLRDVSLDIMAGDRIGLLGANGAGKSTLIKALVGELSPMQGEVVRARDLRAAYFAQHQVEQLREHETPLAYLKRLEPGASENTLGALLGGFGFARETVLGPIGPLSGGEKARLVLAAIIRQKPNLLLLDEPTNHLDLDMRHALGIALQDFTGALIVVSHDRYLLQSISDTLKFIHDGIVDKFDGDLDDYARWLLRTRSGGARPGKESDVPGQSAGEPKRGRGSRETAARNRADQLGTQVRRLEESLKREQGSLAEIESRLADNALYEPARKDELQALLQRQVECRRKISAAETEWLEKAQKLEQLAALQPEPIPESEQGPTA